MRLEFVNRHRELAFLERAYARPGADLLVLWGRRRVGKTALLREFARERRLLYFVGTQSTEALTAAAWSARAAAFFADPVLAAQPLMTWKAILTYLGQRTEEQAWGVVLDEFPYLVEACPSLPSDLQSEWDEHLQHGRIKLIVCGSSVNMMESHFFSRPAPLYGRRTGQWKVEPFSVTDLGLLWPGHSLVELLEAYCVIGGVPMYARRFDPQLGLLQNIGQHILTQGELLYEEVPFLLREELREPRVYQAILAAIAQGAHKFGELSSKTGLDRGHLTRYLGTLGELGLVQRETPVTERQPDKSRRGLYVILEAFVRFWYRFVYAHLSRLESGQVEGVLAEQVGPQLDDYVSRHVEGPLGQLLLDGPLRELVPFEPAFVGRHWSPSEEFDLVALDGERRRAFVAEVKWSRRPVPAKVGHELLRRIEGCEALRGVEVTSAVIARNGFGGRPPGLAVDLSKR